MGFFMLKSSYVKLIIPALFGFVLTACSFGSSVPKDYVPDPALKRATLGQLQKKIANSCIVIQKRDSLYSGTDLNRKCACYAGNSIKSFTAEEVSYYRNTGIFDSGSRRKAYAALERCGLQKP